MSFLGWIIIGGVAGWLGSKFYKGSGSGIIMNIILGIVGGIVGGFVFGLLGFKASGVLASLITAAVGAVIVLWLYNKLKK